MPCFNAPDVEAPRTECAVKIEVSMPASSKTLFIHRATDGMLLVYVDDRMYERNKLLGREGSLGLKPLVTAS
jgi:hypothetical protein